MHPELEALINQTRSLTRRSPAGAPSSCVTAAQPVGAPIPDGWVDLSIADQIFNRLEYPWLDAAFGVDDLLVDAELLPWPANCTGLDPVCIGNGFAFNNGRVIYWDGYTLVDSGVVAPGATVCCWAKVNGIGYAVAPNGDIENPGMRGYRETGFKSGVWGPCPGFPTVITAVPPIPYPAYTDGQNIFFFEKANNNSDSLWQLYSWNLHSPTTPPSLVGGTSLGFPDASGQYSFIHPLTQGRLGYYNPFNYFNSNAWNSDLIHLYSPDGSSLMRGALTSAGVDSITNGGSLLYTFDYNLIGVMAPVSQDQLSQDWRQIPYKEIQLGDSDTQNLLPLIGGHSYAISADWRHYSGTWSRHEIFFVSFNTYNWHPLAIPISDGYQAICAGIQVDDFFYSNSYKPCFLLPLVNPDTSARVILKVIIDLENTFVTLPVVPPVNGMQQVMYLGPKLPEVMPGQ